MRFKSILGAFIFITLVTLTAAVIFVQTKTFGRIASRVISDISLRRADAKVKMKSIAISVFPPGVEINQIKINKNLGPDEKFHAEFGKLGFYIGLIEFEERKITLGEIRISDSVIDYTGPEKDEPAPEQIDRKVIDRVFDLSDNLPIRVDTVLLENSRIRLNHDLIEAKRLKLFKKSDAFMTRFHLANLKPLKENPLVVDEIWGDAQIGRKDINIYRLKVQHDVHTLLVKGKIKNYYLLKNATANLTGEAVVHLTNLNQEMELPEFLVLSSGFVHLSFRTQMKDRKFDGGLEAAISDLDTNLVQAQQVVVESTFTDSNVVLKKLLLSNNSERLQLLKPQTVFDFKTKKFLQHPLQVRLNTLDLNNALRFLPALRVLKGKLTGDLEFSMQNLDLKFKPVDGFEVNDLGLVVGEERNKPFEILMIKRAKLTSSTFRVVDQEFQMDSMVELNHSLLDVKGSVNSKRVAFTAPDAVVDLEDFGNISQLDIKGTGTLSVNVSGPLDDVVLNFKGKTRDFEILKYKLGNADKDLSIALKDSNVIIHRLEALYRQTPISGTGAVNYDNMDIALGISSPKASFHDLKEILTPIFSKIDFLPPDLNLEAKVDAQVFGKTSLDKLKVKAETKFTDLIAYGETMSSGELNVLLENQILKLKDLVANKGKGQIRGDFSFGLASEKMKLEYDWDELALSSFAFAKKAQLNFNGIISGSLRGEGTTKDYLLKLESKMEDTKSQDYNFEDSRAELDLTPEHIAGKVALLGSIINSQFDWSMKSNRPSKVDFRIDAPEIKPFFVAFIGQHLESRDFSGDVRFNLSTVFRGAFEEVDLQATLENLRFRHENFNLNYKSETPQFVIKDNSIRRWGLNIQEQDLFVKTSGEGEFGKNVTIAHETHFNSRLLELLLAKILSAEGFIRNTYRIDGKGSNYRFSATSNAKDLNLTIEGLPVPLNNLNYALSYENRRLLIQELRSTLENGSVKLEGDLFFDGGYPDVNVKYSLDKAEFPVLGKSIINISGEGIILGNEIPYNIGGEIIVNKAQIVNELTEFNTKSNALSQVRFLPPSQESPVGKFVNLNLNVKIDNPARISNSLMDVSLKGELMLLGSPTRPRGEGHLFAPANSSRVFFKNNEYFISNSDLNFSPKKEISNPDFDVLAVTYISSYKVNAKAYGDLERFNFDLTSDPSLTRNSILSLIAFGYTDEIQSSLTQGQQQNLTQVGVGSFVFDRFKISDILNKQFGLQVNLGTVFEQSQTESLLSGRTNQDGQGTLGRTRSATKIELKKRLDEALSLSVSSTMGGSIGQRQSMNLNYTFNKNVQVEGVYELRTNEEGVEDVIDNSIGGDLKFRKTFK